MLLLLSKSVYSQYLKILATPFELRPFGVELALCQRYYEKSYSINVAPASNSNPGRVQHYGSSDSSGGVSFVQRFVVPKRANPQIITYNSSGTNSTWNWERSGAVTGTFIPVQGELGTSSFSLGMNVGASFVVAIIWGHWVAEAEL